MFMSSLLIQLIAVASAGVCRAIQHIGCYHIEDCAAFASDFPDGIALFVSSDFLKECESVFLQTCVVLISFLRVSYYLLPHIPSRCLEFWSA